VAELHDAYFAAGADISETNTFSGTTIAQADYRLGEQDVWDINYEGARIGREVADRWLPSIRKSRVSSPARSGR
jgi:5-methyltetrahydrofolate--homocysteine methyltransferase